ncbi:NAD(P)/FAD-dependent oxidoreductase [Paracoccus sp. J55]|uniref:NAD(P)/FAD-dependent oxidoreductase n=1 Tax=Paracoccus sp. J55 TaxID=935849 RepID=UPI00048DDAD2|nr:FAD-dependent oxidoreductase [Paracoccus sp. J55]
MERRDVVIVGAGHAGVQAAALLRQNGFAGTIRLISDEADAPYERPPLSKEYLAGEREPEKMLLRKETFWDDKQIERQFGRAVAVDAPAHVVRLADGTEVGYGRLIWAAGGGPRRLTCGGHDLQGIHAIRTRQDVDRLREELPGAQRIVVIGGGYIGLEASAVLVKQGKDVTLLEATDRVLSRVAGPDLSAFYHDVHRAAGVKLRFGARVDCILGESWATGVQLAEGEVLPADMVIIGIGIVPAVEPLLAAGAKGGNGVHVDANCRTTLPDVFAIGDCAAQESPFAGGMRLRIESIQNANDQAAIVAKLLTGKSLPEPVLPTFWSNQFSLKLQTLGLSVGHDATVLRGKPEEGSFSVLYLKDGQVIALDCVNAVKDYAQGRMLIQSGARFDARRLADTSVLLKELVQEIA